MNAVETAQSAGLTKLVKYTEKVQLATITERIGFEIIRGEHSNWCFSVEMAMYKLVSEA